jgi:diadenosine tetraphosphate (Ap4A) HIT family hydrolase
MACPFCSVNQARVFMEGDSIFGIWDEFPVSPGHALLITRRHVPSWFELTAAEMREITAALGTAKAEIELNHKPDGYNIGINSGEAAGQTIFHLHVHLIPRYQGDIPDPRGGVRNIFPGKAAYWDDQVG